MMLALRSYSPLVLQNVVAEGGLGTCPYSHLLQQVSKRKTRKTNYTVQTGEDGGLQTKTEKKRRVLRFSASVAVYFVLAFLSHRPLPPLGWL